MLCRRNYSFIAIVYLIFLKLSFCAISNVSTLEDNEMNVDNKDSIISKVFPSLYDNQIRIESNKFSEKCIIAVRFRSCIALGYLRKKPKSDLIKVSTGGDIFTATSIASFARRDGIVNITDSFIAAIVSVRDVDSSRARRVIERINRDSQRREGSRNGIAASRLSARLADLAHENTMYPNGWATSSSRSSSSLAAVNAVIVDPVRLELYLVDLSGNRFACRSVGAGFNAKRINHWLETRGRYLATSLPEMLVNCSSHWNISDGRDADMLLGLEIFSSCIAENIGLQHLAQQNHTLELMILSKYDDGIVSCLGPLMVPSSLAASMQSAAHSFNTTSVVHANSSSSSSTSDFGSTSSNMNSTSTIFHSSNSSDELGQHIASSFVGGRALLGMWRSKANPAVGHVAPRTLPPLSWKRIM